MRLSDVKGERTLDVIADLVEPIARIAEDEEAMAFFKPKKPKKGQTNAEAFAQRMRQAIPVLIRAHKEDLVEILATIKGVTPKEYVSDMTLANVVGDVFELLTDEEFLAFLPSQQETKV